MYRGVYLNLSRNERRRESLTRHLAEIGAASRYERCEAVDGRAAADEHPTSLDPGNLGLWLSHEKILRELGDSPAQHLHIIEDDAQLARNFTGLLDGLLGHCDVRFPGWDVLFTDVFLEPRTDIFKAYCDKRKLYEESKTYTMIDLARVNFACTTSLVINKSSMGKYARLIAGQWKQGKPIDIFLRELVHTGQLKAFLTIPFITTISEGSNDSDIRGDIGRSRRVCDLFRRGLFQDADVHALLTEMQQLTSDSKISSLAALYLNAEMFTLGDKFVRY
jgi:GR25 family glycosyltransferase involved in LPS biosynthesis